MQHCELVRKAYDYARKNTPNKAGSPEALHRERSANFVACLSEVLEMEFSQQIPDLRVFIRGKNANRPDFGLTELLFDIALVEADSIPHPRSDKPIGTITRCLVVVESEFSRNPRQALKDFNKLVLANADVKLFIGPRLQDQVTYLECLASVAKNITGDLFLALVPHPDSWSDLPFPKVHAWKWDTDQWEAEGAC